MADLDDETASLLYLSRVLDTGLSPAAISAIRDLCELGVNPNALAAAIRELRRLESSIPTRNVSRGAADRGFGHGR